MFVDEEKNRVRVEKLQTFRPLPSSLAGGLILLFTSGVYISHGFIHWETVDAPWTHGMSTNFISFAAASWFIGSIIGYSLTPMVVKSFTKKQIYVS